MNEDETMSFQNTNPTTVINSTLNSLASGRTWKENVLLKGQFAISEPIKIPSYTSIFISRLLKLVDNAVPTADAPESPYGKQINIFQNSDRINGNTNIEGACYESE